MNTIERFGWLLLALAILGIFSCIALASGILTSSQVFTISSLFTVGILVPLWRAVDSLEKMG